MGYALPILLVACLLAARRAGLLPIAEGLRAALFLDRRRRLLSAHPEWRPDDPRLRREGSDGPISWVVQPNILQRDGLAVPGMLCRVAIPDCAVRAVTLRGAPAGFPASRTDALALPAGTPDRLSAFLDEGGRLEDGTLYLEFPYAPSPEIRDDLARAKIPPLLALARDLHQPPALLPARLLANLDAGSDQERLDRLRALIRGWPDRLRAEPRARLTPMLADASEDVRLEIARFLEERDTLRLLFWESDRPDITGAALAALDGDMFGAAVHDLLGDPRRCVGRAALLRARLVAAQIRERRHAEALPLLLPCLRACLRRLSPDPADHPADHTANLHYLCAALLDALAALAPPDPVYEEEILPILDRTPARTPVVEIAAIQALGALGTARSLPALQSRRSRLIRDARSLAAAGAVERIRTRLSGGAGALSVAEGGALSVAEGGGLSLAEAGAPRVSKPHRAREV